MSSNSVFRMLEILFGERLGLGFKSCSICFSVRSAHIGKIAFSQTIFQSLEIDLHICRI